MNFKINKSIFTSLMLASGLALTSCHADLDRQPTNVNTDKKVYGDPTSLKQAFAKVYGAYALTGNGSGGDIAGVDEGSSDFFRGFFNVQELPTDAAICAWSDQGVDHFHSMQWASSNDFLKGLYFRSLYQIKLASDFLNKTADKAGDATIKAYRAEARFLRAYQYWVLMDTYGNPPFIDESTGVGKVYPQQISRAKLFDYVVSELKAIDADLVAPRQNEYGRADKAAAWSLLARVYINAKVYTGKEYWTEAMTYAQKVIAEGGYKLKTNYEHLFLTDNNVNNTETILSINYDGIKSQNWGGATFLINSSTNADAQAKTGVNWGLGGWGGNRATKALYDLFEEGDKRRLMAYEKAEITNVKEFVEGVWVYKFRNVSSTGQVGQHSSHGDVDVPLFRLAEMYLIYAEGALRSNTNIAKGLEYINVVRERAFGDKAHALLSLTERDIINERGRELYWEGHRRTDLIRFGLFTSSTYLWPWKGGVAAGAGAPDYRTLYPLPADDVQANHNLKQNPNY